MSKIIILMGAPGAGKGTQARLLEERQGWPQISTGDMFRALKNADTPLAREVQEIMAAGRFVPDDLTIRIVQDRTSQQDCKNGYILDGFPRTTAQAEKLEGLAKEQGHELEAILVDVPTDILEKRLTGRRTCPVCGEIYNIRFKPPKTEGVCDLHPDATLDRRKDDNIETVRERQVQYEDKTQPLIDYYKSSGHLQSVDGTRGLEEIYADIEKLIVD
jgi:adenylate kinase